MSLDSHELLRRAVAQKMSGQDATSIDIITAVAGLLGAVAYADRKISAEESKHLDAELRNINGLSPTGAQAISQILHEHAVRFSTSFLPRFTRVLREELPEEHRAEVLDALLRMAAADGSITFDETVNLRNIAGALGLSQVHYNELQERYKDKLGLV